MTPEQIAQLPLAALLILLGGVFFGMLLTGRLRLGREVDRAEKSESEWRTIATKMTETNVVQAAQITALTQSVATLTQIAGDRVKLG